MIEGKISGGKGISLEVIRRLTLGSVCKCRQGIGDYVAEEDQITLVGERVKYSG